MNDGSRNDENRTAGSEAWSTAVTTGTEGDRGAANGAGDSNARDAAGAN